MRMLNVFCFCLLVGNLGVCYGATWSGLGGDSSRAGIADAPVEFPLVLDWRYTTGYEERNPSSPAVSGDMVFFCADKKVLCLDAETGEEKWLYDLKEKIESSPAAADGIVYVGADDGRVVALKADSGQLVWQYRADEAVKSTLAVTDRLVLFGAEDGIVHAVRKDNGELQWQRKLTGPVKSSPAVDNKHVYVASARKLYAFSLKDGTQAWSADLNDYNVMSSPVAAGDKVIACTGDNVRAYSVQKGQIRWQYSANARISGTPAVTESVVVVGDQAGLVHAISLGRGEKLWSARPLKPIETEEEEEPVPIKSATAIAGNVAFVRSENGVITGFNLADGALVWQYKVEPEPELLLGLTAGVPGGALGVPSGMIGTQYQGGAQPGPTGAGALGPGGRSAVPYGRSGRSTRAPGGRLRDLSYFGGLGGAAGRGAFGGAAAYGGEAAFGGRGVYGGGGRRLWGGERERVEYEFVEEVNSSVAIAGGAVYILSGDSTLYALRPQGIDLAPPRVDKAEVHVPTTQEDVYTAYEFEAVNELGGPTTSEGHSEAIAAAAPVYVDLTIKDEGSGIDPGKLKVTVEGIRNVGHEYYPEAEVVRIALRGEGPATALPEGEFVVDLEMSDYAGHSQHGSVTLTIDPSASQPAAAMAGGWGYGTGMGGGAMMPGGYMPGQGMMPGQMMGFPGE